MTLGQFTSLVQNNPKISGDAIASPEIDVHEASIRVACEVAIRYFFKADYRQETADAQTSSRRPYRGRVKVNSGFVKSYTVEVEQEDPDAPAGASRMFVTLPDRPLMLGNNHWLRDVYPFVEGVNPDNHPDQGARIISDRSSLRSMGPLATQGILFAHPERFMSSMRVYFRNAHPLMEKVTVYYAPDPSAYGDDDDLFLPAGIEMMVVDKAIDFFLNPRTMPADLVSNERDDAKPQQPQ